MYRENYFVDVRGLWNIRYVDGMATRVAYVKDSCTQNLQVVPKPDEAAKVYVAECENGSWIYYKWTTIQVFRICRFTLLCIIIMKHIFYSESHTKVQRTNVKLAYYTFI